MRSGWRPSTVQNILIQAGLRRLDRGDRATNQEPVRRYQRDTPGELIHVDIKKLAGIPDGGGWKTRGRGYKGEGAKSRRVGYRYIHTAIDDRSRIAYSEILTDEKGDTAARVLETGRSVVPVDRYRPAAGDHRQRRLLPIQRLAQGM